MTEFEIVRIAGLELQIRELEQTLDKIKAVVYDKHPNTPSYGLIKKILKEKEN